MVLGDKTVFSTLPWLSFYKCEGNQEQDKVICSLWCGSVRSVLRRQLLLPVMAAPCYSSDPRRALLPLGLGKRQLWFSKAAFSCFLLVLHGAGWVMVTLWVPRTNIPTLSRAPVMDREPGTFQGTGYPGCPRAAGVSSKVQLWNPPKCRNIADVNILFFFNWTGCSPCVSCPLKTF